MDPVKNFYNYGLRVEISKTKLTRRRPQPPLPFTNAVDPDPRIWKGPLRLPVGYNSW